MTDARKSGMPPGSLIYTGYADKEKIQIQVIRYGQQGYDRKNFTNPDNALDSALNYPGVVWINIDGLHDVQIIQKICDKFDIHRLTAEDILNINQRPGIEEHDHYLYATIKAVNFDSNSHHLSQQQISLIMINNLVLSFHEHPDDILEPLRKRIQKDSGYIRKKSSDYLLYAIIDNIVDRYFSVIEQISDRLDIAESKILEAPSPKILQKTHLQRRNIHYIKKVVYPVCSMISKMEAMVGDHFLEENRLFIRDLHDNIIRISENIDTLQETACSLFELYMNATASHTNEIMKILTIIATIFIPLTFIVGVYGMNFVYMPEIGWRFGYLAVWGIMTAICAAMIYYFKKKNWL